MLTRHSEMKGSLSAFSTRFTNPDDQEALAHPLTPMFEAGGSFFVTYNPIHSKDQNHSISGEYDLLGKRSKSYYLR